MKGTNLLQQKIDEFTKVVRQKRSLQNTSATKKCVLFRLAPSDFQLLPELKNWLGGQSFQKNEEIQSKVKVHLTLLAATFFEEGIGNLAYQYDK
ncbi:hypothetical protein AVEN_207753-1 [Araneus ventricosus]|uniref:Uncharacterized protein n=1 Tax=Araneus ventricosus TaxID=182803 RepID=A0A4Y2BX69_ARAVE|nr:hypothetical protein AVEN_207753-1 [Araneus ventricosus]